MSLGTYQITPESACSIDTTDLHPFMRRILLSHLLNRPIQIRLLSEGIVYRSFPESHRLASMVFKLTFAWRWEGTGHHGLAACPSRDFKYSRASLGNCVPQLNQSRRTVPVEPWHRRRSEKAMRVCMSQPQKAWFELQRISQVAESMQPLQLQQHATMCAFSAQLHDFECNLWTVSTCRTTRDKDIATEAW